MSKDIKRSVIELKNKIGIGCWEYDNVLQTIFLGMKNIDSESTNLEDNQHKRCFVVTEDNRVIDELPVVHVQKDEGQDDRYFLVAGHIHGLKRFLLVTKDNEIIDDLGYQVMGYTSFECSNQSTTISQDYQKSVQDAFYNIRQKIQEVNEGKFLSKNTKNELLKLIEDNKEFLYSYGHGVKTAISPITYSTFLVFDSTRFSLKYTHVAPGPNLSGRLLEEAIKLKDKEIIDALIDVGVCTYSLHESYIKELIKIKAYKAVINYVCVRRALNIKSLKDDITEYLEKLAEEFNEKDYTEFLMLCCEKLHVTPLGDSYPSTYDPSYFSGKKDLKDYKAKFCQDRKLPNPEKDSIQYIKKKGSNEDMINTQDESKIESKSIGINQESIITKKESIGSNELSNISIPEESKKTLSQPLPPLSIADKKTQDALENLRAIVMQDDSEMVSKTLSFPENAYGEFYQYYFDTQSEVAGDKGVPDSAANPAGNSVLLLAVARAAFRSDYDKTKPSDMVKSILQDAESKLTPEKLKSFVSASYKGEIDYFKNSPLTLAIKTDLLDEALTLIKYGANLEDTCNGGYTPLHLAVAKLHFGVNEKLVNVIKSLVEHGANLNALDDFGRKPVEALKYEFLDFGGLKKYKLISKNLGVTTGTYSLKELFANETIKNILAAKGISSELNSNTQKVFEDIISRESISIRDEEGNRCFTIISDIPKEQDTLIRHLSYSSDPSTKGAMGKIFGYPIIDGIETPIYDHESSAIKEIEKLLLTGELSTSIEFC